MRDIKFRAWHKVDHLLRDVVEIVFGDDDNYVAVENGDYVERWRFDDIELMQYTGLKDVYGVEIYEGDIIEVIWSEYGRAERFTIAFDPSDDGYPAFDFIGWHEEMNGLMWAYIDGQITVIGNRFENP